MYEVQIAARSIDPFSDFVAQGRIDALRTRAQAVSQKLGARVIWNINSTRAGGGVAEMLQSTLRYAQGLGVAVRWLVLEGPPEFFRMTKRLHNALHGSEGDGSPLGPEQAALLARVTRDNTQLLDTLVRTGDVVICHDPQTAGLVPHLVKRGVRVIWRCHIGHERHDEEVDRGWAFLRPCLEPAHVSVFSRKAYAPAWLLAKRAVVLAPNIDPFSVKNQPLSEASIAAILTHVGLVVSTSAQGESSFNLDFARREGGAHSDHV